MATKTKKQQQYDAEVARLAERELFAAALNYAEMQKSSQRPLQLEEAKRRLREAARDFVIREGRA